MSKVVHIPDWVRSREAPKVMNETEHLDGMFYQIEKCFRKCRKVGTKLLIEIKKSKDKNIK